VTNSHDLQGDELPSEWLRVATRSWGTVKIIALQSSVPGLVAGLLPISLLLALAAFDRVSVKSPLLLEVYDCILHVKSIVFGDWFSALFSLICLISGGIIIFTGWKFIHYDVFRDASREKQIWIGGGTTTIGVGGSGISIKTMRAIFALDWYSIEKYQVLTGATSRTLKVGHCHGVERGDAVQLDLRSVGEGRDRCRDVLIIPKRFFDDQSEITWDAFLQTIRDHVP
jgi:hypothetical protein